MKETQGTKLSLLTFFLVLALIIIVVMVFFMYKIYNDKEIANSKIEELNSQTSDLQATIDSIKLEKDTNTAEDEKNTEKISVIDAVNYSDEYYKNFKVQLPKIVGNSSEISKLNDKILNEILPQTYSAPIIHGITNEEQMSKGSEVKYKYLIEKNILIIYIYEEVPNGGSAILASNSGLFDNTYYYDIENDKISTISEVAEKLELDISQINNSSNQKINSYKELETCGAKISINNNNELSLVSFY